MNRHLIMAAMCAGTGGILMPLAITQPPVLIWNASASLPIGLYTLRPPKNIRPGDIVALVPPPALATTLDARGTLPIGIPLLKQVAATAGQKNCRTGLRITIDDQPATVALPHDRQGRPLPDWQGCRRLGSNELFLINPAPDSFDSRYFGPLPHSSVIGRAIPIWRF